MSNCTAYLRQDQTTHNAMIRLPARIWSILQTEQDELAEALGVPKVSRPVALVHILEQYRKNKGFIQLTNQQGGLSVPIN